MVNLKQSDTLQWLCPVQWPPHRLGGKHKSYEHMMHDQWQWLVCIMTVVMQGCGVIEIDARDAEMIAPAASTGKQSLIK